MVGVPQSKGCEACRKQKKSCEGTSIPCVRCKRLKIPCIGRGQQRFKFQDETFRFENGSTQTRPAKKRKAANSDAVPDPALEDSSLANSLVVTSQPLSSALIQIPMSMPTTKVTRLAASFIDQIDPNLDSRWIPPWNFTRLLQVIPSRLGHNDALDASAEAVLAAYQTYRARQHHAPADSSALIQQRCLSQYNRALKALRSCLDDKSQAQSGETLCSTMMLLMFETLMGPINQRVLSHAGGAANIMKARGYSTAKNEFEWNVMLSLRGPVVFQALFSGEMLFTDEEWFNLIKNPTQDEGVMGRTLMTLARIPNLLLRTRGALSKPTVDEAELQKLRQTLRTIRSAHLFDIKELLERLETLEKKHPDPAQRDREVMMLHCAHGRHVATAYSTDMHLLSLLSAVDYPRNPPISRTVRGTSKADLDEWMQLAADRAEEASDLAERVACHRPLGTFYMDYVLKGAYIVAGDRSTQLRILGQIWEYAYDMFGSEAKVDLEQMNEIRDWIAANDLRRKLADAAPDLPSRVQEITEDEFSILTS
ncbi:hypothetical protein K461DRAFT_83900 [Myriangium duriaei CBS 260.36]|uniref:Zn(2)-C6 fungal-type domain-containing protein n=1 Tax=Myriangium duriaei CBS 260.36 TaxID=1168546 RepID=A0A9P4MN58_9PEZI|nr:hypothetical protein K461DRAFT_83900 [Myriangium duriaei CBS 260.36]